LSVNLTKRHVTIYVQVSSCNLRWDCNCSYLLCFCFKDTETGFISVHVEYAL